MNPHRLVMICVLALGIGVLALSAPLQDAAASTGGHSPAAMGGRALDSVVLPLQNLTKDPVRQDWPTVVRTLGGEIVVAWEQDVPANGTVQREIFASSSPDGITFPPGVNLSQSPTKSLEPFLFRYGTESYLLYRDMISGTSNFRIMGASSSAGVWSAASSLTSNPNRTFLDPKGVQASDGSLWFVSQLYLGGTATDAWVRQIGGASFDLSNDGSAVRRPSIAAGDNGQIYVAWIDHANEYGRPKPGINVRLWNGTAWVAFPNPTTETNITFANVAYRSGKLYVEWPSAVGPVGIKQRLWQGTVWGPTVLLAPGSSITCLETWSPPSGNLFRTWLKGGYAYLQRNNETPIRVSGGLTGVKNVASFVDDNDETLIVMQQNYDIWFTALQ